MKSETTPPKKTKFRAEKARRKKHGVKFTLGLRVHPYSEHGLVSIRKYFKYPDRTLVAQRKSTMQIDRWRADATIKTADKRKALLRQFEQWLDQDEPQMGDIVAYIKQLDRAPGTVRNHFYAVKDYFLWLKKQDATTAQDYANVTNIEEMLHTELEDHITYSYTVSDDNFLTRHQIQDIFQNTRYLDDLPLGQKRIFQDEYHALTYRLLFGLMYFGGRRLGECTSLTWADIDLDNEVIEFIPEKKANPDPITVDVSDPPELADWLREFADRTDTHSGNVFEVSDRTVREKFSQVTDRCESFNDQIWLTKAFRHSIASHLRADGVPMEVISQEILHHKDISTTQDVYAGHITEKEKAAIDKSALLEAVED